MDPQKLLAAAHAASDRAVAPYSEYPVGAAVAADGRIYPGCNIEVANYTSSIHAEAVAVARSLFDGAEKVDAIAVSTAAQDGATPCGSCRQLLREYAPPSAPVYIDTGDSYRTYTIEELLPEAFAPDHMTKK